MSAYFPDPNGRKQSHWFFALFLIILVAILLGGCSQSPHEPTVRFPEKLCRTEKTGQTRGYWYTQCFPIGNNPCGTQSLIWIEETEVKVSCAKHEWR